MELRLKVKEAFREEAYTGIIRIDSDSMKKLGVMPRDVISIVGGRKTVAIVERGYPTDIGQEVIRMDGITRRNARTAIGETVIIKKAEEVEAKSVKIAPASKGISVHGDGRAFQRSLMGRAVIKGDQISLRGGIPKGRVSREREDDDIFEAIQRSFGFGGINFIVADTNPKNSAVLITENTEILVEPKAIDIAEERIIDVTYEDIGGLTEEIKKIREMVEIPLKYPQIFDKLGIQPPAGVLLHGPPGTGKTLLAKAVANETNTEFKIINGPEIMNKFYGESEKRLREIFEQSGKDSSSIIFIDEIDAIAPKREEVHGEVERRVVSQLLTLMDGLKSRGKLVVIGATNRPNAIDPALRRPGRFDREIVVGVPDYNSRLSILKIHTRNMPLAKNVKVEELAQITHGFVGADLAALCKEAAMNVLRKIMPGLNLDEKEIPKGLLENLQVESDDFKESLKIVRPSAMREVLIETPNINWTDVGGLDVIKQNLKEAVEWPLKNPEAFKRVGVRPPKGILLYGPPGTGKTLLAKAVAKESEANFILVKGPELLNMWVGESERGLRNIFEKARQAAPTIIFFDEIDSLVPKRGFSNNQVAERMVNTLLSEMDGLEEMNDIVVIGATNRPDMLDVALLRPGRFDRLLLVDVPDESSRLNILRIHTKNMPLSSDVSLKDIAKKTVGFVGADIESLCREAGILSLRENISNTEVSKKHFEEALLKVKASVPNEMMEAYKEMEDKYLRNAKASLVKETPNYFG